MNQQFAKTLHLTNDDLQNVTKMFEDSITKLKSTFLHLQLTITHLEKHKYLITLIEY